MGNNTRQMNSILTILRICTILLAAVSFWSTAQGMEDYTFPNGWQAYAASLGIQGLLLGLNFAFPEFWRSCKTSVQKSALLFLTVVILLCSSWFSYLYIAGKAYGESWDTECQILAQSSYRSELFDADEYTEQYSEQLETALAGQISVLYDQAKKMDQEKVDVGEQIDWSEERERVGNSAASDLWNIAIDSVSSAIGSKGEGVSQTVREQAASALMGIQASLQSEIDRLEGQIQTANENVQTADANLQGAQRRLENVPGNVDPTPYENAVTDAAQNYNRAQSRQKDLEQERDDYQRATRRISDYALILGMTESGVSSYFVGANLREIQRELFQPEPDSARMMELATEIFDRLQGSVDLGSQNEADAENQNFLLSMRRFVQGIETYRSVKEANSGLRDLIAQLADGTLLTVNSGEPSLPDGSDTPQDDEIITPETAGSNTVLAEEPFGSDNALVEALENGGALQPGPSNGDADLSRGPDKDADIWKEEWIGAFNDLKARISGLPVYILSSGVSQEDVPDILKTYERADSTAQLDSTIRRYLTKHNAVQEGIIYLASPYRSVAIFSLIVALLLDISAFITGVIIDRVSSKQKMPTENDDGKPPNVFEPEMDDSAWSVLPGLRRYAFLTGDFMFLDGIITYKIIENGKVKELEYPGPRLNTGFYAWKVKELVLVADSEKLLFRGITGGPQDGIYQNCSIGYDQGLLIISQNGSSEYVGSVDPDTPVYQIHTDHCDVIPARKMSNERGKKIVVALNYDGTKIIAIYVIN